MKLLFKIVLIFIICGALPATLKCMSHYGDGIDELRQNLKTQQGKVEEQRRAHEVLIESAIREGKRKPVGFQFAIGMFVGAVGIGGYFCPVLPRDRLSIKVLLGFELVALTFLGFGINNLGYKNGAGGFARIWNQIQKIDIG